MLVCAECSKCSWYRELDLCGGLTAFQPKGCPIEKKLTASGIPSGIQSTEVATKEGR